MILLYTLFNSNDVLHFGFKLCTTLHHRIFDRRVRPLQPCTAKAYDYADRFHCPSEEWSYIEPQAVRPFSVPELDGAERLRSCAKSAVSRR